MKRDERGSATLFALTSLGILLFLGCALAVVAALVSQHRVAQSAADLAALAAASAVTADPCARGAAIAQANGADLTSCVASGREVSLEVRVTGPQWWGRLSDLRAHARAGPTTADLSPDLFSRVPHPAAG